MAVSNLNLAGHPGDSPAVDGAPSESTTWAVLLVVFSRSASEFHDNICINLSSNYLKDWGMVSFPSIDLKIADQTREQLLEVLVVALLVNNNQVSN